MSRGVLLVSTLDLDGQRVHTCTIDEAFGTGTGRAQYMLKCKASDAQFIKLRTIPADVKLAGEYLYKALVFEAVGRDFFAQQQPLSPLFIHIGAPDAEDLPWETLWEAQRNFMALDPQGRWPIARMVAPVQQPAKLERLIGRRLRIAIVLAAARELGASEWDGIKAALDAHAGPMDVLALVSEDAVKEQIAVDAAAWIAQGKDRNVEVEFVGDASTIMTRLRAHVPNIIHFFCHGVADVRPQLELETRIDRKTKTDRGSISLGSEVLIQLASASSLWLVALNCCQGAKTAPQLHSLARDLVAAGVPAVVAMRESVEVKDANLFAQHFYSSLLPGLSALFTLRATPSIERLPVEEMLWVRAIDAARRPLQGGAREPGSSVEWSYPVLYVHRDPLELLPRELKVSSISAAKRLELVTELDVLRAVRRTLDGSQDAGADDRRAVMDAHIRGLEMQLAGQ